MRFGCLCGLGGGIGCHGGGGGGGGGPRVFVATLAVWLGSPATVRQVPALAVRLARRVCTQVAGPGCGRMTVPTIHASVEIRVSEPRETRNTRCWWWWHVAFVRIEAGRQASWASIMEQVGAQSSRLSKAVCKHYDRLICTAHCGARRPRSDGGAADGMTYPLEILRNSLGAFCARGGGRFGSSHRKRIRGSAMAR